MQRTIERMYKLGVALLLALALLAGAGHTVRAQDGGEDDAATGDPATRDEVTLLSVDSAFPVLFQALAPGEVAEVSQFQPQITLSAEDREETPLIYIAVENTGWSEGTIGVFSDRLDANEDYVALEVRDRGMPGYAVREDGQGLVMPLAYEPDLGPDGEPGFRLHLVIGSMRSFRIFRVVDDGLMLFAQQNMISNGRRVQERTIETIDPDPVFGDLVLEAHIEARPVPVPAADAATDTDG